jgi:hypothetical protein
MDDMWRRTQTFSFFYFFTLSSFPIVLAVRPRMGGEATRQTAELVGCVCGGGWGGSEEEEVSILRHSTLGPVAGH